MDARRMVVLLAGGERDEAGVVGENVGWHGLRKGERRRSVGGLSQSDGYDLWRIRGEIDIAADMSSPE